MTGAALLPAAAPAEAAGADQFGFQVRVDGFPDDTFAVSGWSSEERISAPYRIEIDAAVTTAELDLARLCNSTATFSVIDPAGVAHRRHGILTEIAMLGNDEHYVHYRLVLEPRIARLRNIVLSDVYVGCSISDLIEAILPHGGMVRQAGGPSDDYDFRIAMSPQQCEQTRANFCCQFQESELAFLSRRLAQAGVSYYFEQGESCEAIVFSEDAAMRPATVVPLWFRPDNTLRNARGEAPVEAFRRRMRISPGSVVVKDFAGSRAALTLSCSHDVGAGGSGEWHSFGEHFDTESAGQRIAQLRAERLACEAGEFTGTSRAAALAAGCRAALQDHFRDDCNATYYVTEVRQHGRQPLPLTRHRDTVAADYGNTFVALADALPYRPPLPEDAPKVTGLVSAVVDGEGEAGAAELDEHGRYKVRFPFARTDAGPGRGSAWVRLATPYAGSGHGMHFPLHKGSEVLIAFVNGDPDRPVIVGALANSENPNVVSQANHTQNMIRSAGGNSLVMEDRDGHQALSLASPSATSSIQVGAAPKPGIALASQGHVEVKAGTYRRSIGSVFQETIGSTATGGDTSGGTGGDTSAPTPATTNATDRFISASYAAGRDNWFSAGQDAGVVIQDYFGASIDNYFGGASESVQGINSLVVAGLDIECYLGAQITRCADKSWEYNDSHTEFTALDHEWTVAGSASFTFGSHRLSAGSGNYAYGLGLVTSARFGQFSFSAGASISGGDGVSAQVGPIANTLSAGPSRFSVGPSAVNVTAPALVAELEEAVSLSASAGLFEFEGNLALSAQLMNLTSESVVVAGELINLG